MWRFDDISIMSLCCVVEKSFCKGFRCCEEGIPCIKLLNFEPWRRTSNVSRDYVKMFRIFPKDKNKIALERSKKIVKKTTENPNFRWLLSALENLGVLKRSKNRWNFALNDASDDRSWAKYPTDSSFSPQSPNDRSNTYYCYKRCRIHLANYI